MSRFPLGRVVATPGALTLAEEDGLDLLGLLGRHASGDWGDLPAADRRMNESALRDGSRIFSAYGEGASRLYVITDPKTDACPACVAGVGRCDPDKGEWLDGLHFRTDREATRLSTTILRPEDY